jgi:hypothetical protein
MTSNGRCAWAICANTRTSASKVEARRFAAIEGGLCTLALFAGKLQPIEHCLCSCNLVSRYYAVGLAQRTHDGKRGFKKLRLHRRELLQQRALEYPARQIAQREANEQTANAANHEPDERKEETGKHGGRSFTSQWIGRSSAYSAPSSNRAPGIRSYRSPTEPAELGVWTSLDVALHRHRRRRLARVA